MIHAHKHCLQSRSNVILCFVMPDLGIPFRAKDATSELMTSCSSASLQCPCFVTRVEHVCMTQPMASCALNAWCPPTGMHMIWQASSASQPTECLLHLQLSFLFAFCLNICFSRWAHDRLHHSTTPRACTGITCRCKDDSCLLHYHQLYVVTLQRLQFGVIYLL